jgi:hypothetical protein
MSTTEAIPPSITLSLERSHHKQIQAFTTKFNKVYNQIYFHDKYDDEVLAEVINTTIDMALFDKITLGKRYQGRIALIDGKIRFDEIPQPPHGEVVGYLTGWISNSIGIFLPNAILMPCTDNGMYTQIAYDANCEDIVLSPNRKKRPDFSWRLDRHLLPNPPPAWLILDASGQTTANLVLEIVVENESPDTLMSDCDAYFGAGTSTTVWVGVKIWLAGRKFWVGWAERSATGVGALHHTQMHWVPNHTSFLNPVNIIYQIPMQTVYGAGIPVPAGAPPTLPINAELIHQWIVRGH